MNDSISGPVEAASRVKYSIRKGLGLGFDPSFQMLQLAPRCRCCDLMPKQYSAGGHQAKIEINGRLESNRGFLEH